MPPKKAKPKKAVAKSLPVKKTEPGVAEIVGELDDSQYTPEKDEEKLKIVRSVAANMADKVGRWSHSIFIPEGSVVEEWVSKKERIPGTLSATDPENLCTRVRICFPFEETNSSLLQRIDEGLRATALDLSASGVRSPMATLALELAKLVALDTDNKNQGLQLVCARASTSAETLRLFRHGDEWQKKDATKELRVRQLLGKKD